MAFQTLPITMVWGPTTPDFVAKDINELGTLVAKQLAGAVRADVSFILQNLFDPTTNAGTGLIFNLTQGVFKYWNTATGTYIPVTQYAVGDLKTSLVGADTVATGWVVLNGRAITAIPGLSGAQLATLQTLFPSGSLPVVSPQNLQGIPPNGSFSGIPPSPTLPANGVIGALPIGAGYTQTEVEDLRDDTEILRDSTAGTEAQVAAVKAKAEELIVAINNNTAPPLFSLVFVGFA